MDLVNEYNQKTAETYRALWGHNLVSNLPYIKLWGFHLEKTSDSVIIVGAGPSLDYALNMLKVHPLASIWCVDTAVKPLVRAGIKPDLVVTIDPQKDLRHFVGKVKNVPLVAYTTSNPDIIKWHDGEKHFINNAAVLDGEENILVDLLPVLGSGGNVATVALAVAENIGYKEIMFVGVDLAADFGQSYATGCLREGLPPVELGYGGLRLARNWVESFLVSHPKVKLINVTRFGVKFKGAKNVLI